MITKSQAIHLAEEYIGEASKKSGYHLVLLSEDIVEFDLGWVFTYQSKKFVETGDILEMVTGNAPIIINKQDGSVYETGTGYSIKKYIDDYRSIYKNG